MNAEDLKQILMDRLTAVHVEVFDDSAKHRGHAGPRETGGGHFQALIISNAFSGLTPVARHQKVYAALRDEMSGSIHALSLKLFTPPEWTEKRGL